MPKAREDSRSGGPEAVGTCRNVANLAPGFYGKGAVRHVILWNAVRMYVQTAVSQANGGDVVACASKDTARCVKGIAR